jgi:hypothetical protein
LTSQSAGNTSSKKTPDLLIQANITGQALYFELLDIFVVNQNIQANKRDIQ